MRVAVISDIHANGRALEAVLGDVDAQGVDEVWCLGDVVGYGPDPNECCALMRERASLCLVGNHDLAVLGVVDTSDFNLDAALATEWTRRELSDESREFLSPLGTAAEREGLEAFHGSPLDPVWDYVLTLEGAEFTEGGFRDWGYQLAVEEFGAVEIDGGPWCRLPGGVVIKDVIADAFLQQILTRPKEYSVIATLNLNGDYISDALAAQVGGIGIAPGANINYRTGHAVFEATHGTAPKYAGQDKVNPGSVILSGEMMFRYLGWNEAADLIIQSLERTIAQKRVTYDFERLMPGSTLLKTSEFGEAMVANMA